MTARACGSSSPAALLNPVKPGRTTAVAHGGQVDDDGDIAVAPPGVAPYVLIDAEDLHTIEAVRIV